MDTVISANADTKESVNYDLLSRLPENGIVINTARKDVMSKSDMVQV